jgi:alcohol dehydrogenase class IV
MMTQTYQFKAPSVIVNGPGASKEAGTIGKGIGRKALIVTDTALEQKGVLNEIKNSLETAGLVYSVYNKVVNEPTMAHAEEGLKVFKESGADFLIAVGGGSPIDAAKAVAALATNPGRKITEFMGPNKIPNPGAPLIAIPTTAGTGSEVTQFTIITDTDRDVKMLIASPMIMPKAALVDPLLTLSMPQNITMATGLDALTHAIEAYVSVKAHPLTDTLALQAIRIIAGNLRQAWSNGDNVEARTQMLVGSLHAGLAFSNASVALVHGMARPIGAYFHVPHGVSNAALLPIVIEFSIPGNPRRYAEIAEAMGEVTDGLSLLDAAYLAAEAVERLNEDLKVPTLEELGVDEEKFNGLVEKMAEDAIASGSPGNNPRKATKEEIVELYKKAY